jgi:hypothetical protein
MSAKSLKSLDWPSHPCWTGKRKRKGKRKPALINAPHSLLLLGGAEPAFPLQGVVTFGQNFPIPNCGRFR